MTTSQLTIARQRFSQWITMLQMPLYRNGLALVIGLVTTSGLGIVYWALAARNYPPEVVGMNSAIISAMMFLANIAQFGMVNFLTRFIPTAGSQTPRMILLTYVFSISLGLVVAMLFLAGTSIWSPSLRFLWEDSRLFLWFVVVILLWSVFALQDGVMVGLRQSQWVPVENTLFAITKIILLVVFAQSFTSYGIFASWTSPVLILILVVNFFIFRVFVPRHVQQTEIKQEQIPPSQLIHFIAGDYLSTLVWTATTNLMPVMIIERVGPEANAYFYLPWMIAYSLFMVSRNLGLSLTVEASRDQSRLTEFARRSLSQTAILLVPIVLVIVLGSPWILSIFGNSYSTEGDNLLRLLALSALPNAVISLYISIARVQRKVFRIVVFLSLLCSLAIGLTLYFLDRFGLVGIGAAWLISQLVIAGLLLATDLRTIIFPRRTGVVS